MLRTALRPKWLALLALVLAVIAAFTWLGLWQMNVAQHRGQEEALAKAAAAPEAPVEEVLPPGASFTGSLVGRRVVAAGRYEPQRQLLVAGRRLGETTGYWVLVPLVLEDGARLPVVRGFVASPADAPPAPTGPVRVHGGLQPSEGSPDRPHPLPEGQVATIDLATFVNTWEGDLVGGFVLADAEEPAPPAANVGAMARVPSPAIGSEGINWRNAFYALQWWVFAIFALYLWWRMVRDAHLDEQRAAADRAGSPPDATGAPDASDAPDASPVPTPAHDPAPTAPPRSGGPSS